ncbi:MAG: porin family protein [Bacteroidales bacterium]
MKKHILLFTAFVFFCSCFNNLSSQSYRINMGLNSSNMLIKNSQKSFSDNINFNAGLRTEFPLLNDYLSFEAGFLISTKGYKTKYKESIDINLYVDRTNKTDLYYLDMPLTLKLSYNYENIKIFGKAGPYMSLGLFKKNKLTVEDYFLSETHTNWLGWDADADYNLKRFDFGLSTGIGIEINPIILELSYNIGLANISASASNEIYNRNFAVSVGYKLNGEPSQSNEHFISFSPKVGQANGLNYACFGNSINYHNNSLLVSADYFYFLEFMLGGNDSFHLLGISTGKRFIKNRLLFDVQLGSGLVLFKYNTIEQSNTAPTIITTNTDSTIALNIKSALKYFPNEKFAIGIDALLSFNKLENLYALPLFSIEYGIMR